MKPTSNGPRLLNRDGNYSLGAVHGAWFAMARSHLGWGAILSLESHLCNVEIYPGDEPESSNRITLHYSLSTCTSPALCPPAPPSSGPTSSSSEPTLCSPETGRPSPSTSWGAVGVTDGGPRPCGCRALALPLTLPLGGVLGVLRVRTPSDHTAEKKKCNETRSPLRSPSTTVG